MLTSYRFHYQSGGRSITKAASHLRLSLYNWLVPCGDDLAAFNGMTGALALVEPRYASAVSGLFGGGYDSIETELSGRLSDISEELITGGFVIRDDFDERGYLKMVSSGRRYSPDLEGMTVVMTTACNMRCTYCYEGAGSGPGAVISDRVVERIQHIVRDARGASFHLCLYGGEPLLAPRQCIELAEGCLRAAEDRGASFSGSIVTNGSLLGAGIAEQLAGAGIELAQVTVDGSGPVHDARRPSTDGSPTCMTILRNVREASRFLRIVVRMNVDYGAPFEFEQVRLALSGLRNVTIDPRPTRYHHCMDLSAFDLNRALLSSLRPGEVHVRGRLHPPMLSCAATVMNGMVVLPDGELLRCWDEIGDPSHPPYGSIFTSDRPAHPALVPWMSWDPYSPGLPCYDCRMLPTCGGGCPYMWLRHGQVACRFSEDEYRDFIAANYSARKSVATGSRSRGRVGAVR